MALLATDCPHCGTAKSAMVIFGVRAWPSQTAIEVGVNAYGTALYRWDVAVAAACQNCHQPVAVHVSGGRATSTYADFVKGAKVLLGEGNLIDLEYTPVSIWPKAPQPNVPANVPPSIERAMLQAERNYPMEGNEEASAMMYRRSLELTLKDLYPDLTGTLAKRIKNLVENRVLPEAMGDWADEIRQLGNDAAHDAVEVTREQLTMIRGFTDATLRYLYTLPAEVAARRKPEPGDA